MIRGRLAFGVAALSLAATAGANGCGSGDGAAAQREACYPPCVAHLMSRCPLVSTCTVEIVHYNPDISDPIEDDGVAACYADREKTWDTQDAAGNDVTYVEAADGSLCYQVTATDRSTVYTMYTGGTIAAVFNFDPSTNITTAFCPDGTSKVVPDGLPCQRLPWINVASCDQGACSFGALPAGADVSL